MSIVEIPVKYMTNYMSGTPGMEYRIFADYQTLGYLEDFWQSVHHRDDQAQQGVHFGGRRRSVLSFYHQGSEISQHPQRYWYCESLVLPMITADLFQVFANGSNTRNQPE